LLNKDPNWSKEDFVPFMNDLYSFNGQWYGIPFNWGPSYFHYNVDLFQNAGLSTPEQLDAQGKWNWDVFSQSVRRISKDINGDGAYEIYGYRIPAHAAETLINAWVAGNGGGYVDNFMNPTRITIGTSATRTALEFLHGLITSQGTPPITNTKFNGSGAIENAAFANGTLGIYDQWMSGSTACMTAKANGTMANEWGVVASPISPTGKRASDIGSAYAGIGANSPNAAVVYDFFKFHLTNVNSLLANQYVTSLPPVRKVLQSPEIQRRLPVAPAQRGVIVNAPNYPAFRMIWAQQGEFWKIAKAQLNRYGKMKRLLMRL
jgi:ABC-type glycerol-3-phosphate transport system substrate-binding protein